MNGSQAGLIAQSTAYEVVLLEKRAEREAVLKEDRGWLTLAGLFWLHPGENRFGAATDNDLVLPGSQTPAYGGLLRLDGDSVTLEVAPGVLITTDGASGPTTVTEMVMQSDMSGALGGPDFVTFGSLTFFVLQRGSRIGIRLYDIESPVRDNFRGLSWYPIVEQARVTARFEAYDPPKPIQISNLLGDTHEAGSPGKAIFEWDGQICELDAEDRGTSLFFNFGDQTNKETTYPAGRFLSADLPQDGSVILDFNQATNPYCAYTAYAVCPLPPKANHLAVRIEAGEQRVG